MPCGDIVYNLDSVHFDTWAVRVEVTLDMSEEQLGGPATDARAAHLAAFAAEMDQLLELPAGGMATRVLFEGEHYQVRKRAPAPAPADVMGAASTNVSDAPPPPSSPPPGERLRLGFSLHIVGGAPVASEDPELGGDCELTTRLYTPMDAARRLACYVDTSILYERAADGGWSMVPRIVPEDGAVQLLADGVRQLLNCPPPPDAPYPPPRSPPRGPPPPTAPPPAPFDWCVFALIVGPYAVLALAAGAAVAFWALARRGRVGKRPKKAAVDLQWWARSWKVIDPKPLALIATAQWLVLAASQVPACGAVEPMRAAFVSFALSVAIAFAGLLPHTAVAYDSATDIGAGLCLALGIGVAPVVIKEHAGDAMAMEHWSTAPFMLLAALYLLIGSVLLSRMGRRLRVQLADPVLRLYYGRMLMLRRLITTRLRCDYDAITMR